MRGEAWCRSEAAPAGNGASRVFPYAIVELKIQNGGGQPVWVRNLLDSGALGRPSTHNGQTRVPTWAIHVRDISKVYQTAAYGDRYLLYMQMQLAGLVLLMCSYT